MDQQLDLDLFLNSHSTDSDSDSNSVPHRTLDEILNDSDSDTSPSLPNSQTRPLTSLNDAPSIESLDSLKRSQSQSLDDIKFEQSKPPSFTRASSIGFLGDTIRRAQSTSSAATTSSSNRPLPSLFGGVRSTSKPGAALAAATAASRSIPTPYAAAIKSRRVNQKVLDVRESSFSSGSGDNGDVVSNSSIDESIGIGTERSGSVARHLEVNENLEGSVSPSDEKLQGEVEVSCQAEASMYGSLNTSIAESNFNLNLDSGFANLRSDDIKDENEVLVSELDDSKLLDVDNESSETDLPHLPAIGTNENDGEDSMVAPLEEDNELEKDVDSYEGDETNIGTSAVDDVSSMSDISELVEERIEQLESEMISRREEKKRKSTMKPLESAEELEKKQASTGLHWEEGAAAQPMKLEGVRRGSTTLGYFDINADNLLTRTIVSQTFRRDHGTPQVVAVHLNYIAVGMTKGVIVVVPSRYSPHNDDSMDTKMLMLGLQGDRSNAAVTSMCFNHQGDLLLAGYGDGRVTVWDVQRVSAAKVITGEHNAPVVHTLFLGQDSQATRQFKAVTGDSKGLVLLHAFSVVPLLNRFSIKTQCLLDGQRTGTVLSASPLLFDDSSGGPLLSSHGNGAPSSSSIGSMMGGVVGGDSGWKLFNEGSSLIEEGIVIFVTHQTALVVRLTPSLEVYAQLSRPDGVREGSMPYTAWKYVTQSQGLTIEPVERVALLAIAWDRKVQLAKLVKSELKVYGKWSLDSAAIGVAWLDAHMLVVLTTTGQLYLFASDGTVIHQTSFGVNGSGGDDLAVYHTHFINIYGNPEKSYHNCLGVRGASLYILGPMHLIVARLLPWKERIQVLRRAGDWMGALNMAMTLYDGQAHGVIDLPRSVDAVKEVIMPYLVELLLAFVDEGFSYISVAFCNQIGKVDQHDDSKPGSDSVRMEIKEQFTRVGGVAVEFCVHIQRTDILFDEIFSKFIAVQHRDTFLELLEPYILKDMLGSLPPEIMQALVEHYSSKGWLQRVEQCVLHMDISSLDFNQVVRLCREHGLYGALVYLFNKGLNDFRAPLEELLVASQNSPREPAIALGYRTLVYLKYCFSGLAFPPGHGSLPPSCLPVLKKELVEFLLETPKAARNLSLERNYLNLHYLLSMDTEATLDVLKFAFMDGENQKPEFLPHESDNLNAETKRENNLMADNQTVLVQNTINALVQIIEDGTSQESGFVANEGSKFSKAWPSDKDLGNLFEFIADYVACGKAHISSGMLSCILEYLTSESIYSPSGMAYANETPRRKEKKVIALLETVSVTDWSAPYVLQLCEKAFFHQVCGLIHTMRHDHLAALDSFMKDVDEPIHTFCYINSTLQELSGNEHNAFRSTVMSRIPELAILSREGTFLLVIDNFSEEASHILTELRPHPKSLFLYLKTIIEVHLSGKLDFSKLSKNESLDVCKGTVKDQLKGLESYLERLSDFPKFIRNNPVHLSDDMIELYLELLCQFERDSVLKFLETFDSYRVEHCLRLCQEYGIIDAAAFLLERVGDVGNALSLILSGLNDKFVELDAAVKRAAPRKTPNGSTSKEPYSTVLKSKEVEDIRSTLHSCIELCQRNTPRLQPEESETHWFRLLDSFCQPLMDVYADKRTSKDKNRARKFAAALESMEGGETLIIKWKIPKSHKDAYILRKLFSQFIKEIVEGMIGYVRLPTIMSKLLSDNCGQEFGDFKFTILGMLGTYGFERRILDTAKSLIEDDTFYTLSLLKKGASHGYAPRSLVCCICNCLLSKNASSPHIRVFNCGHATHLHCELLVSESSSRGSLPGCPICMPKKNSERQKSKLLLSESGLVNQVSRRPQRQHGTMVLHPHEDTHEYTYGSQQISRFEILHNLQKAQKLIQIEHTPMLKLAPPAVYHDKIKKRSVPLTGETSSGLTKVDKSAKAKEGKELKAKGPSLRFPLKSSIFGKEVVLPNRKNNNNLR